MTARLWLGIRPEDLSLEDVCLVMDELLCRQIEYFLGETPAESVLTLL
jgi:hypothetical protein